MLIAVWGTLPENTSSSAIETLEIIDFDGYNEDLEKVMDVKNIVTISSPVYLLEYTYTPSDAYAEIVISVSDADIQFQHDAISRQVYIYYSVHAIQAEIIITVTIKDQRTQKIDMITLWFQPPDVIIVPDL